MHEYSSEGPAADSPRPAPALSAPALSSHGQPRCWAAHSRFVPIGRSWARSACMPMQNAAGGRAGRPDRAWTRGTNKSVCMPHRSSCTADPAGLGSVGASPAPPLDTKERPGAAPPRRLERAAGGLRAQSLCAPGGGLSHCRQKLGGGSRLARCSCTRRRALGHCSSHPSPSPSCRLHPHRPRPRPRPRPICRSRTTMSTRIRTSTRTRTSSWPRTTSRTLSRTTMSRTLRRQRTRWPRTRPRRTRQGAPHGR